MTFQGRVHQGVVVFDGPDAPPEGATVAVSVLPQQVAEPLRNLLLEFAGTVEGLPHDMAEQHDHYIHGRAKQ